MSVKTYSYEKDRNKKLSTNFKVSEFRCKDKSDKILISEELVKVLQDIRDHFKKAVKINSAYRTEAYNKKIGGAQKSQHVQGKAADIVIDGVTPKQIALYAQSKDIGGIGLYDYGNGSGFCHVDVRAKMTRWIQTSKNGSAKTVSGFGSTYSTLKQGSQGEEVKELQQKLNQLGYDSKTVDGIFGSNTKAAVKAFQSAYNLTVDGIAGQKTWEALEEALQSESFTLKRVLKKTSPLMKGDDVQKVQQELIAKGYPCGSAGADGMYGEGTESAVKKFQKANGLSVDGQVGKNTVAKLGGTWV